VVAPEFYAGSDIADEQLGHEFRPTRPRRCSRSCHHPLSPCVVACSIKRMFEARAGRCETKALAARRGVSALAARSRQLAHEKSPAGNGAPSRHQVKGRRRQHAPASDKAKHALFRPVADS
jgi:hypothetical protein